MIVTYCWHVRIAREICRVHLIVIEYCFRIIILQCQLFYTGKLAEGRNNSFMKKSTMSNFSLHENEGKTNSDS